jgi:hypothetical protein
VACPERAGISRLSLRAGERRDLLVRRQLSPEAWCSVFGPGCEPEPILQRHPIAGVATRSHGYGFHLFMAPGIRRNPASVMNVRVRHPREWLFNIDRVGRDAPPVPTTSRADVKLRPDRRAGVRGDVNISSDGFGLRGALDFYPPTSQRPHAFEGSFVLQMSL